MGRLGLGYDQLRERCPRFIDCSITGFGQSGRRAQFAGHDLNYLALSGLLAMPGDREGAPTLPFTPIADIAGGTYPALTNILLALLERERSGRGCRIDVSMTDNHFTLAYWALSQWQASGEWPRPGRGLITGGSPRYQVYACADGRHIAAAPIEERFWQRFCELIGLAPALRGAQTEPASVTQAVTRIIAGRPGARLKRMFEGADVCCCLVNRLEDAVRDPHFTARGPFARRVASEAGPLPALPVPSSEGLRSPEIEHSAPRLGVDPLPGSAR